MKKKITDKLLAIQCAGRKSQRRGSLLIEGTAALALLVGISLVLMNASINVLKPRLYTIHQNMSDAQISYEVAYANRVDFDTIASGDSEWPLYPASNTSTVTIGTLAGGKEVTAEVKRFRKSISRTASGGNPVISLADLGIEVWELQSVVIYKIGGKEYAKACTVIRSQ